jgi:ABC-2 type transport system permease protein
MSAELFRQLRRRRTWFGLGGVMLVPIIIALAFVWTGGDGGDGGSDPTGLFQFATASGLNFALISVASMSGFLLPSVVALFTGDTVSSEANWGSLRYLLTRPITRSRLLWRKLAVGALLAGVALLLIPLTGLLAGWLAFGWGPVATPFGALSAGTGIGRLALATAYIGWSVAWVGALAFMLSTLTDAPVGAVAGTIVIVIVVQILDAITALGDIRMWLPVHEANAWIGLLAQPARTGDMGRGVLLQLPYVMGFLAVGWWYFGRKDITS